MNSLLDKIKKIEEQVIATEGVLSFHISYHTDLWTALMIQEWQRKIFLCKNKNWNHYN